MPNDRDKREEARRRYWQQRSKRGWRCPGCGRSRSEVERVDVHHRDGNPNNNDPDNLVALCKRCHLEGRHQRDVDEEALTPPQPIYTSPPQPGDLSPP